MGRPRKESTSTEQLPAYAVIVPFQDAREHCGTSEPKFYNEGDDVSHFDAERLALAVQRGLVQANGEVESEDTESENAE